MWSFYAHTQLYLSGIINGSNIIIFCSSFTSLLLYAIYASLNLYSLNCWFVPSILTAMQQFAVVCYFGINDAPFLCLPQRIDCLLVGGVCRWILWTCLTPATDPIAGAAAEQFAVVCFFGINYAPSLSKITTHHCLPQRMDCLLVGGVWRWILWTCLTPATGRIAGADSHRSRCPWFRTGYCLLSAAEAESG